MKRESGVFLHDCIECQGSGFLTSHLSCRNVLIFGPQIYPALLEFLLLFGVAQLHLARFIYSLYLGLVLSACNPKFGFHPSGVVMVSFAGSAEYTR